MTRVRRPLDQRLGQREERVAEAVAAIEVGIVVVELLRDVAGQLQVLLLVLADRHVGGPVDQDVGRHQLRIGVEPDRGVLAVLAGLLLELRHAVEPADAGDAVEDPGELGVLGHLALVEDDVRLRVDAGGEEGRGRPRGSASLQLGRILPHGDRVQVDDAVDAVVRVLQRHEALDARRDSCRGAGCRSAGRRRTPARERRHDPLRTRPRRRPHAPACSPITPAASWTFSTSGRGMETML